MKPLILASASPRRKDLLEQAGISFSIVVSDANEQIDEQFTPEEAVLSLAEQKATTVFEQHPQSIVLGSDTVVSLDGEILGKPASEQEAFRMLRALSGRTHQVFTGVCIVSEEGMESFYEEVDVSFYPLTDEEITAYINTQEAFDKAGGYGIQGVGSLFVERISGDYFSVVGLPVSKVVRTLASYQVSSHLFR
ncbi:Maf family protein [Texcoconibacillus texcoconensis]|uniref:dTTP/UTP pyrophosphatase n=1 Tax=Texcoconibacillus texcoconensis TaxID=1095777 RepID=A0A840QSV0_9BACI|nr:Maf family protein [Texcoconibacillus texcoconensis]MBB5174389.1 septum formation protein [Texcoconibacillus texcoconensis]